MDLYSLPRCPFLNRRTIVKFYEGNTSAEYERRSTVYILMLVPKPLALIIELLKLVAEIKTLFIKVCQSLPLQNMILVRVFETVQACHKLLSSIHKLHESISRPLEICLT